MQQHLPTSLLTNLAATYGTPLYIYNTDIIKRQFNRLQAAFSKRSPRFFYAGKALTNPHILRYLHSLGAGIDCSSINEVLMALYAGIPAPDILYTSNGIHFEEIKSAAQAGVNINIDSLSNLKKFGDEFGDSYPVGVRLRPNIMAGGNLKISTGHSNSKFGIPIEQIDQVLDVVKETGLRIRGLHIHTGSEVKDVAVFLKGVDLLFDLTTHFPQLEFIDLGGGFKVPYQENEGETDIELLAAELEKAFDAFEDKLGKQLQMWFEPGKFLVRKAGFFLTQVNVIKQTPTVDFVSVNSGFNHLIRPMFYDSYHQITNISNPEGETKPYAVVGNICETDTFAWERALNEVREGDLLLFHNAGAYGFEMSSNFNSRYRPPEIMVTDENPIMIRRRENFDDLVKALMPLD